MKKYIVALIAAITLLFSFCNADNPPIIDEALLHLDKPYIYATAGPQSFDCSGFVYYCFKTVEDIELQRSAREQGYDDTYPKITNSKKLLPGDAVYFNTNKSDGDLCDHAGLYIGDGQFTHCSSAKGKVLISSLEEGYYHERFSWGRRILNPTNVKGVLINEYYDQTRCY